MKTLQISWAGLSFAVVLAALAGPAAAQLSSEQQSALRANCRSDFMSKCSGVTPGGKEALACLQKNVAGLSAGCKAVISTTLPKPKSEAQPPAPVTAAPPPPPAPAPVTAAPPPAPPGPAAVATPAPPPAATPPAAPAPKAATVKPPAKPAKPVKPAAAAAASPAPTAAQQNAMRSACRSDFMSHCSGVAPGGKEALACLQKNVAALSPGCKTVVGGTLAAPGAATAAAPPAAVAPAVAGGGPSPEQMNALKFTCRGDFNRHCKGIAPGPQAFACLQANQARLSPNCRTSVAAIADDMPAGAAAMPVAAPAVAPVPDGGHPSVANAVVLLRACKLDLVRHCQGVQPGGGRELACLAAHEASLSMRCKTARSVTAPIR